MSRRRWVSVAVGVAVVPLAVAAVRALLHGQFAPNGDVALIELRVRDIWSHTPLVGSYQRNGFNMPGPAWFYLLFLPYNLVGRTFAGLQVGAVVVNIGAIAGIAMVSARRGGVVLLLWSLTLVAILVRALGTGPVSDPWEPHAAALPCALLFLLAADAASGRVWALPATAVVATVLAQAYLVVAPIAIALFAWALVSVGLRHIAASRRATSGAGRAAGRRTIAGAGLVTVVLLGVLWAPPLVEQLRDDPGNVQKMRSFFRAPHDTLGLADGWSAVGLELGHDAPWFRGDIPLGFQSTVADVHAASALPIGFVVLVAACGLAVWRRSASVAFAVTALFMIAASAVALSRLVGEVFPWILQWTRAIGLACWLAAGWCAWSSLPDRARARLHPIVVPALALALIGVTALNVVDAVDGPRDPDRLHRAVLALRAPAVKTARKAHGPVLVSSTVSVPLFGGGPGAEVEILVLALDRAGVDVVVDAASANRYGKHRAEPGRATRELRLTTGNRAPDGFEAVAVVDPMAPGTRDERVRLQKELRNRLGELSLPELRKAMSRAPDIDRLVRRYVGIEDLPPLLLAWRDIRSP